MAGAVATWALGLALAAAAVALAVQARRRHAASLAVWRDAVRIAELTRAAVIRELAGSVAEELGTPVTSVVNNVGAALRMLERGPEALAEARVAVEEARAAAEATAHVVRRLRQQVGMEAGRREPLDLNHVAREAIRLTRWHAEVHGVRLRASLEPRLPRVRGDAVQLLEAVLALVLAAVDAAAGSAARAVELRTSLAADVGVALEVVDSGPSVSERDRPQIFTLMSRVRGAGVGGGLAMARSVVEAHGGRLTAERPAAGALFRVLLPAPEPAALEAAG